MFDGLIVILKDVERKTVCMDYQKEISIRCYTNDCGERDEAEFDEGNTLYTKQRVAIWHALVVLYFMRVGIDTIDSDADARGYEAYLCNFVFCLLCLS